jgi:hypothetical protein
MGDTGGADMSGKILSKLNEVSPRDATAVFVPKTEFGRKLLAIREAAIKEGMKLLTDDEVIAEVRARRGDVREG